MAVHIVRLTSGMTDSAARRESTPAKRSGSGSPTMLMNAVRRSISSLRRWIIHGGAHPTASSGANSALARRRWLST
jgi:hypothetical protein